MNINNQDVNKKIISKNNDTTEEKIISDSDIIEIKEKANNVNIQDQQISELKEKLSKIEKRENENILRLKAEMENVRRRCIKDIEKTSKFSLEMFATELLPVIDNLERALETSNKNNTELDITIEGIKLTLKSLINVILKFGINIIEETNIPFDPKLHQAIKVLETESNKSNHVIEVMQKGYILHGRLLRPAMVIVSK